MKVGNFVEIKNSTLATDTKVNHLSYVGDAKVGKKTNIGAGTIFCNYDGKNKHRTVVGDNVFVGSNVSLIAPLKIGNASIVATIDALPIFRGAIRDTFEPTKTLSPTTVRCLFFPS